MSTAQIDLTLRLDSACLQLAESIDIRMPPNDKDVRHSTKNMMRNQLRLIWPHPLARLKLHLSQLLTVVIVISSQLAWSQDSKIGPGVLEELQIRGSVGVIIALNYNPIATAPAPGPPDLTIVRPQIAQIQSNLMSQLDAADYQNRLSFTAVPAMAGIVRSITGLIALSNNSRVLRVDLDVGGGGSLANSVPHTGADERHATGNAGGGVIVAVLDSGLDTDHVNLSDNLVHEACFLDNNSMIDGLGLCPNGSDRQIGAGAAEDDAGHGSHVTGIVTSNGSIGSSGAAPDTSIVSIKVTAGPSFSGTFFAFSEIVAALDYIINNPNLGVQVINMSLGTFATFSGDCDTSTAYNMAGASAINTLRANGIIAFASAGNNGSSTQMTSPACLSNVLSVGAADNTDTVAAFTNSNASTDIFGPGVNVVSSSLAGGTAFASGTSMASPTAAGCAALLIETGEAVTPDQIEARFESSPFQISVPANGLSFPRIDCRATICNGQFATVILHNNDTPTSNADVILGTPGPDQISGMGGDDTICGLAGADMINGGRGSDWIDAGDDDDQVLGANDNDIIFGGAGNDTLFGGPGDDEIYGEADDDSIAGNSGADLLDGGDGIDDILGGSGNDIIFTGIGATVGTSSLVDAGSGNDDIFGGPDADVIRGSTDTDTIRGGDGNDLLYGGGGEDVIYGEEGADLIRGNGAADFLSGGPGIDDINGYGSNDTIEGGDDSDILRGSTGNDIIYGGPGNDDINGGGGNDMLFGQQNDDTIIGGGSNDDMNGGDGSDICDGQSGIDTETQCETVSGVP